MEHQNNLTFFERYSSEFYQAMAVLVVLAIGAVALIASGPGVTLVGSSILFFIFAVWATLRWKTFENAGVDGIPSKDAGTDERDQLSNSESRQVMDTKGLSASERKERAKESIMYGWIPVCLVLTALPLFVFLYYFFAK